MSRLIIESGNCWVGFYLTACIDGRYYPTQGYTYYSLRDAIKAYRQAVGLVGKHLKVIDYRRG